jgi:hypothetical protein
MAAMLSRRAKANKDLKEDWTDAPPAAGPKKGYRPARGTWGRREK